MSCYWYRPDIIKYWLSTTTATTTIVPATPSCCYDVWIIYGHLSLIPPGECFCVCVFWKLFFSLHSSALRHVDWALLPRFPRALSLCTVRKLIPPAIPLLCNAHISLISSLLRPLGMGLWNNCRCADTQQIAVLRLLPTIHREPPVTASTHNKCWDGGGKWGKLHSEDIK